MVPDDTGTVPVLLTLIPGIVRVPLLVAKGRWTAPQSAFTGRFARGDDG
ncbi:MAG: hypothetical protein ABSD81_05375 [Methanomicrobiales archaeon]